jgi:hypothetical protein
LLEPFGEQGGIGNESLCQPVHLGLLAGLQDTLELGLGRDLARAAVTLAHALQAAIAAFTAEGPAKAK